MPITANITCSVPPFPRKDKYFVFHQAHISTVPFFAIGRHSPLIGVCRYTLAQSICRKDIE